MIRSPLPGSGWAPITPPASWPATAEHAGEPLVLAIRPQGVVAATAVELLGWGFDLAPCGNDVRFDTVRAYVLAATACRLLVIAPARVRPGALCVTTRWGASNELPYWVVYDPADCDGQAR